jgi:hypothetical protein
MEIKPTGAALMSKLCIHLTDLKDLKWTGKYIIIVSFIFLNFFLLLAMISKYNYP